ncbi:hypothetical protein DFJ58DRAFT_762266 [Suillus subalutaceus]|uniref:uncharacterized protein n=1 Tax=Suillus subalutaceus TaxID=48586 RepID=UPI001B85C74C|nr:uncharacterized protein DFJ58DRAFT_762266 [Suillus subalutaceus]KAG1871756.1 hypothetical protein DFJ58DRAFT_762266 [Suillus subalutaceus]
MALLLCIFLWHHMDKALESDYPLLGAVLHPCIRVAYFEDKNLWPTGNLGSRAQILLEHLYGTYETDDGTIRKSAATPASAPASPSKSALIAALTMSSGGSSTAQKEVDIYLSGLYPCSPEQMTNPLQWWKVSNLLT